MDHNALQSQSARRAAQVLRQEPGKSTENRQANNDDERSDNEAGTNDDRSRRCRQHQRKRDEL